MKVLVLNGPNLNLLGVREPAIYGTATLADVEHLVEEKAAQLGVAVEFFQSNHEGVLVDTIQDARNTYDGIVYNPAAHTHYSIAIRDAIAAIELPVVEVHISDVDAREPFRKTSVVRDVCIATVSGHGIEGYGEALEILVAYIQDSKGAADVTRG